MGPELAGQYPCTLTASIVKIPQHLGSQDIPLISTISFLEKADFTILYNTNKQIGTLITSMHGSEVDTSNLYMCVWELEAQKSKIWNVLVYYSDRKRMSSAKIDII